MHSPILVVEDEVIIRVGLADALSDVGLSVVEAADANEALEYLLSGGEVGLVFTDISMPGSLDGIVLARRVRAEFPSVPVILASGNRQLDDIDDLGLFIPKPYRMQPTGRTVPALGRLSSALGLGRSTPVYFQSSQGR